MAKLPKRTVKDEYELDKNLRREHDVMREVINELREDNKRLNKNLAAVTTRLIEAQSDLTVYREQIVAQAQRNAASDSKCVPNCQRHYWDNADGWHARSGSTELFLATADESEK